MLVRAGRKAGLESETAARRPAGLESTSGGFHALAHAAQSKAWCLRGVTHPATVVADRQAHLVRTPVWRRVALQPDEHLVCGGVLVDVGEPFLNEPVERERQ